MAVAAASSLLIDSIFECSKIDYDRVIAERTVKLHSTWAREAFGVATTTQAVVEAVRRRLIHP